MKTLLSLLTLCAMICAGCNVTRIQKGETKAFNARLFWSTEGFDLNTSSNGTHVSIQKSNPDAESLKAVAEGAAKGAVKGVAP